MAASMDSTLARTARRDRWRGVAAGVLASLALLAVVAITWQLFETISLLDAMADALLLAIPMGWFSFALETFGAQAKTLMLAGLMIVLVIGGGLVGWTYARQTAGARRVMWLRAVSLGIALFGLSALFMIWFIRDQRPDVAQWIDLLPVLALVAVEAAVFTVVLAVSLAMLRQQDPAPGVEVDETGRERIDRRRLATRIAGGAAAVAGLVVIGRAVARVANRPTVGLPSSGDISSAITPNEDFYVISKNFVDPNPDVEEDWSVTVDGVVEREIEITRAELEAIAAPRFVSTLTCISNQVGGPLIGTARWHGARLADVLRQAGVGPGAVDVKFTGVDGYTDSIPIERALAPEPMLVWEMNGVPLPSRHGTPVRMIVPGLYGIKNIKWLTTITVENQDYKGYWQVRGWTDDGTIKTQSRFDVPGDRSVLNPGRQEIGGIAFGGDRGISQVEVSFDGGSTWTEASIRENPSPDGFSWVIWSMWWDATEGTYDLVVRATDGMGETQTEERAPELPDGSSGWHQISVGVV